MIALPYYLIAALAAVMTFPARAVRSLRSKRTSAPCASLAAAAC